MTHRLFFAVSLSLQDSPTAATSSRCTSVTTAPTRMLSRYHLPMLNLSSISTVFYIYLLGFLRAQADTDNTSSRVARHQVLRKRGQGIGILVSKCPKETNASYSLQDPGEVMDFLLRLVEWKRKSSPAPAGVAQLRTHQPGGRAVD